MGRADVTSSSAHLVVHPERCDQCGRCVRACPGRRLKVGGGYIYVDVQGCEGCFSCVEVCEKAAIVRAPTRPVASAADGRVVVGSRAEAKALRKAAEKAQAARSEVLPSSEATGAPWTLLDAVAISMVLLITIALKDAVLDAPALQVMPAGARVAAGIGLLGIFYALQVGALVFLARRHRHTLAGAFRLRTGFDARAALVSTGLVAVLAVGTRLASLAWGTLASAAGWGPPAGESLTAVFGSGPGGLVLAVVFVVVVGPVTEELAFRGVMAGALDRRFGRIAGVLGSAALFAFYHVTPWLFIPMFAFGCALAWLSLTRRSLWPAIALHVVYNGVVVAAAFWLAR